MFKKILIIVLFSFIAVQTAFADLVPVDFPRPPRPIKQEPSTVNINSAIIQSEIPANDITSSRKFLFFNKKPFSQDVKNPDGITYNCKTYKCQSDPAKIKHPKVDYGNNDTALKK